MTYKMLTELGIHIPDILMAMIIKYHLVEKVILIQIGIILTGQI